MMDSKKMIARLDADLGRIAAQLDKGLRDLEGPLGELVRPQLQHIQPLTRAAVVLTTSYSMLSYREAFLDQIPQSDQSPSADCGVPLQRAAQAPYPVPAERVHALSAAVEMLYIALTIHQRLIQAETSDSLETIDFPPRPSPGTQPLPDATGAVNPVDKTFLGGTILAGDYCFSQASQLAAATENAQVVAHFAQTLQAISEGMLREEFQQRRQKADRPESERESGDGEGRNQGKDRGNAQNKRSIPPDQPQQDQRKQNDNTRFDEHRLLLIAGAQAAMILHGIPIETSFFERVSQISSLSDTPDASMSNVRTDSGTDSLIHSVLFSAATFAGKLRSQHSSAAVTPSVAANILKNGGHGNPAAEHERASEMSSAFLLTHLDPYWEALYIWWQRAQPRP